jgi:hypothetical protein
MWSSELKAEDELEVAWSSELDAEEELEAAFLSELEAEGKEEAAAVALGQGSSRHIIMARR